jgi:hypothetical protein
MFPEDFKYILRITPAQFNFIVEMIQGHDVFLSRGSKPQADVVVQLKVALHRLGHDGSLSSYRALSLPLATSVGSVVRYTASCVEAIYSLHSHFVRWPSAAEKRTIKDQFGSKFFKDAIGAVDGTMVDLYKAPPLDRDAFSTRKHSFSIGATAVCDHQGIFTYFATAYLARRHDAIAYQEGKLHTDKDLYFSGEEYILADAAYTLTETVIPRYKAPTTADQTFFNILHSRARAKIEHAFGMLKGKFRSLTNLRINIATPDDLQYAGKLINVCVVLHNITRQPGLFDAIASSSISTRQPTEPTTGG